MSDSLKPHKHSLPGSSVHGILQARILEWVAIPFSRGSSQPRYQTQVSGIAGRFFTVWATSEAFLMGFPCGLPPWVSLVAQTVKNLPAMKRPGLKPWVMKIPWKREWLPTPVFLSGEFHEQRSLAGYSPWGRKELDMTEWLTHLCIYVFVVYIPQYLNGISLKARSILSLYFKDLKACSSILFVEWINQLSLTDTPRTQPYKSTSKKTADLNFTT